MRRSGSIGLYEHLTGCGYFSHSLFYSTFMDGRIIKVHIAKC